MKTLRKVHLYAGIVLAIPLFFLAISGMGLVFKESIWRLQYPALAEPVPALSAQDHGRALDAIHESFEPEIVLVKWPQPGVAAYQVWLADGTEAFVEPLSHEVIAQWRWYETPMSFLAETHIHLLAGDTGKTVAGILGLCLLALLLTGAVLWWPRRRFFRWKSLKISRLTRPALLGFHRDLGVILGPLAIVIIGAGVGVAFFQPARILLNGLFGDDAGGPLAQPPAVESNHSGNASTDALVKSAEEALPDGDLVFFLPDTEDTGVVTVRKRMPEEMHPNGLSFVYLDTEDASVVKTIDASRAPPGDKVANMLYPVHSAKWGGVAYKIVVLVNGFLIVAMLITGIVSYFMMPSVTPRPDRRQARI